MDGELRVYRDVRVLKGLHRGLSLFLFYLLSEQVKGVSSEGRGYHEVRGEEGEVFKGVTELDCKKRKGLPGMFQCFLTAMT